MASYGADGWSGGQRPPGLSAGGGAAGRHCDLRSAGAGRQTEGAKRLLTARSNRQLDPSPSRVIGRLKAEADQCYSWSNGPGAVYPVHAHHYRKILYVFAGSITFTPEGSEPILMKPGDRIEIPAGTPHSALVGNEGVTCWEGRAKKVRGEAASGRSPEGS